MDELPKVIERYDLLGLDRDGRPCEACGEHMHYHEWAVLDKDGFSIFCNIAYEHQQNEHIAQF